MKDIACDLCVLGAGAAGLSVAAGAAQLGLSVVLFEPGEMGGDCLNHGCVPSKALIAAAKRADDMADSARFGISADAARVDWPAVQAHIRSAIAAIEPNDSQARFEGLGVTVIREAARFSDARTVVTATTRVRARRFVIATGSRPAIPPIEGIGQVTTHTNESIFGIDAVPAHLLILGGGAIGIELGQAFRRLGARVMIIEAAQALGGSDREAADIVIARLRAEGIEILEGWRAASLALAPEGIAISITNAAGERQTLTGSHLLIATGRTPTIAALGLDQAGIAFTSKGITVSPSLRTSNSRVWALGDAAGGAFTHIAGWHASVFVRNVLFKAATHADALAIPSVVFTDPELAQIGLTEAAARTQYGDSVSVARWGFDDNDRAHAAGETEGFCKLIVGPKGRILGATLVGADAGELLAPIALAMAKKLPVRALTEAMLPYPTRGEIVKRAAGAHFTPLLFSARSRALVNFLKRIP